MLFTFALMAGDKDNIRLQKFALIIGFILLVIKFAAYFATNSIAILSDALESIVNIVAGLIGLASLIVSAIPRDKNHPYGHGKVEFVSGAVEGTMVLLAGLFIIGKAIYNFFYPVEVHSLGIGLGLAAGAGLINFLLGYFMVRKGRKNRSHALEASGVHLKSDAYSSAGLVLGVAIIWITDIAWLDNIVAMIFGGLLIYTGYKVIRSSLAGILDEADLVFVNEIITLLEKNRESSWIDLHNFRVIRYGDRLHIDSHLTVPYYFSVQEAHDELEKIGKLIEKNTNDKVELFVHIDPCVPQSCRICTVKDCPVRKSDFIGKIPWTTENLFPDLKH